MLELDTHLTEDELLALRERRLDDARLWSHLLGCTACKRRFAFLGAFKAALTDVRRLFFPSHESLRELHGDKASEEVEACCSKDFSPEDSSDDSHPDADLLAAYFRGGLGRWVRTRVHEHVVGCDRCLAEVLVHARRKTRSDHETGRASRGRHLCERAPEYLLSACRTGTPTPRTERPQYILGLEDGPGTEVRFRVLGRPDEPGRTDSGRLRPEERIEILLKDARVTVAAHREGETRYVDVEVRSMTHRRSRAVANVSFERDGRTIREARTDERGAASLAVPAAEREFDLRVDGRWTIPVLLRIRS